MPRILPVGFGRAVCALLLLIALLPCAARNSFGQGAAVDSTLWVTNGPVNTLATDGNTMYLGGGFDYVGPPTGGGVPISTTTGGLPPSFPKVEGVVLAIAPDGAGGWFLGGQFSTVGGLPRQNLAHVGSSLTVTAWNPGADLYVFRMVLSGSTLYVGGAFSTVGGQTRNRLAAVNASTGAVTAWNPDANGDVWGMAVTATTVYVGGYFSQVGGQTRQRLAALNTTTGAATAWNPSTDAASLIVQTIAVNGSTVYVGGAFANMGGQPRNNIAAIDASTGLATSWNPNSNGQVLALAMGNTSIYAGGYFTSMGGVTRNRLAEIRTSNGAVTSWNPGASEGVITLQVVGSTVYVGGFFTTLGGATRNRAAAIDVNGSLTSWNPNVGSSVYAISVVGTTAYTGGIFGSIGGVNRKNLAAIDLKTGAATNWNPVADDTVKVVALAGNNVYVGGKFLNVGGQARSYLAAVNANNGNATSWNPAPNGGVRALALSGNLVYAGGDFTAVGVSSRNRLAAIDASSGTPNAWNPGANGIVQAFALNAGILYVGGSFTAMGGSTRNFLGAFNATTGLLTTWNPGANAAVLALSVDGAAVHVGGRFTTLGGTARNYLGAATLAGGVTSWNPSPDAPVDALVLSGATLYAGGDFTTVNGFLPRNYIAAFDTSSGEGTLWVPGDGNTGNTVLALSATSSRIYAGGMFGKLGGHWQPNFGAAWAAPDLQSVFPASGGNAGTVTLTLTGHNLQNGSALKLIMDAEADLPGTAVSVSDEGTVATADFDLTGAKPGAWHAVVTTPDGQAAALATDFMVETVAAAQLKVSVLGPPAIRADYPTSFDVVIENPGNVDALNVPLWITGIPTAATVTPDFALASPPQAGGEPNWSGVPTTFTNATAKYLPLVIPRVPPGTTTRRIVLSVPSSVPSFNLRAAVAPLWGDDPVFRGCLNGAGVITNPSCMGTQLASINSYLSTQPQVEAMSGTGIWAKVGWQCEGATTLALAIIKSEQVLDYLNQAIETGSAGTGCVDALVARWQHAALVSVVFSIDPNDKLGPSGGVSSLQSIPYSIRFENLNSATVAARTVTVEDVLSTNLDLNSLSLDAINLFGTVHLLPVPGSKQYSRDVDLGHDNLIVRITANLDMLGRKVTWSFATLDKTTLQPPSNPLLGFLPPNQTPPQGEGSVQFTIRPASATPNGTTITNGASIRFDGGTPINTPVVSNVLDNLPPASNVQSLGTPISTTSFPVSWSGSGTDLKDYTIYVKQDANPYTIWKQNTTTRSDTYVPQPGGHAYAFYSVARDMTGNIEPAPPSPDAQTFSTTAVEPPGTVGLSLMGAQPNPARGVLRVAFSLPNREKASLELIDVAGRRVLRREIGDLGPGSHVLTLGSAPTLKSGLYFIRLVQGERALESRVVLMR